MIARLLLLLALACPLQQAHAGSACEPKPTIAAVFAKAMALADATRAPRSTSRAPR